MSVALLVRCKKSDVPVMISRESTKISDAVNTYNESVSYPSRDITRLHTFHLNEYIVRDGEMTDSLPLKESQMARQKTSPVELSYRTASFMFLADTYDYSKPGNIVIASQYHGHITEKLATFIQTTYPSAKVMLLTLSELHEIYDPIANTAENIHENSSLKYVVENNTTTYLISLETSLRKHTLLVEHFNPLHALFSITIHDDIDIMFYPGNMWLSPFTDGENLLFLRSCLYRRRTTATGSEIIRASKDRIWSSNTLFAATMRYYRITRENVAYINPFTGSNEYLFGKYENDFSHMFTLHAMMKYYRKLAHLLPDEKKSEKEMSKFFDMLVSV
jgi:hypothetical protein